jgi:predicted acetyltransferase
MTKNVTLVKPTIELQEQYLDFYREWKNGGKADADYIEEDGNVIKRYWISNK